MVAKRKLTANRGSYIPDSKRERLDEAESTAFGVVGVTNSETANEFTAPEALRKDIDPLGVKSEGTSADCESITAVDKKPSVRQVSAKQSLPSPGSSFTLSSVNSGALADSKTLSSSVAIISLLEHPFTSGFWKVPQQDGILTQPIPLSRRYRARETWYERFGSYPWLCESDDLERYFCWPCLLYDNPENIWSAVSTTALVSNPNLLELLEEALVDHQNTTHHVKAESLYMRKNKISNAINTVDMELWKCLVQTIFAKRQNNAEMVCSAEYESKIQPMMEYFFHKKITPKLAFALSKGIVEIASAHIKKKAAEGVQKAQYVALHIEDLSPIVVDNSVLVAIARYTDKDGRIHDRVMDFINISTKATRSEHVALELIRPFLENYTTIDNVIGLSYSATLASPKDILLFNNSLMMWCPKALFFHPPSHSLYKSLFEALSHSVFCRKYLQELHCMRKFLMKFPTILSVTPTLLDENFPREIKSRLSIFTVVLNRIASGREYKNERLQATRYLQFLSKVDSRFMMILLDMICSCVEKIAAAVAGPWTDLDWINDLKYLINQRDEAVNNLKVIALRGIDVIAKDELLSDAKSEFATGSKRKYQAQIAVIVKFAVDLLSQRFQNFDSFRSTRSDLLDCSIKESSFILALFGKRLNLSDSEMKKLESVIKPHPNDNRTLRELLRWLTTEKKQQKFPLLYKYLLFARTISRDKSAFGNMLESVYKLTENKPLHKLTTACLDGYFWHDEDVLTILEDPEFNDKALKACRTIVDGM